MTTDIGSVTLTRSVYLQYNKIPTDYRFPCSEVTASERIYIL